jgi:hypothetical protein
MTTPDPNPRNNAGALAAGAVLMLALVGGGLYARSKVQQSPSLGPGPLVDQGSLQSLPQGGATAVEPQPNSAEPEVRALPAPGFVAQVFWLDVLEPATVHAAVQGNAWANKALQAPLGKGFVGGWAALFGTRGDDVPSGFKGQLLELFSERLLAAPYRVVWFGGKDGSGVPAVVIDGPTGTSQTAWSALLRVGQKGGFNPEACPEPPEGVEKGTVPEKIFRFSVAEQVLFGVRLDNRLVFSRSPTAALQGSCLPPLKLARAAGRVAELGVSFTQAGRGAQAAGALMGLGDALRFGLTVENGALVPTGLLGTVEGKQRLGAGPPQGSAGGHRGAAHRAAAAAQGPHLCGREGAPGGRVG